MKENLIKRLMKFMHDSKGKADITLLMFSVEAYDYFKLSLTPEMAAYVTYEKRFNTPYKLGPAVIQITDTHAHGKQVNAHTDDGIFAKIRF